MDDVIWNPFAIYPCFSLFVLVCTFDVFLVAGLQLGIYFLHFYFFLILDLNACLAPWCCFKLVSILNLLEMIIDILETAG